MKKNISLVIVWRALLLFLIPPFVYGLSIIPPFLLLYFGIGLFSFDILHVIIFALLLIFDYFILIFSLIFTIAFFIQVLNLKYEEGEYQQNLKEKMYFKYNLYFLLYYPAYRVLNFIVYPPLKSLYLRLIGAKIGRKVFLALDDIIFDPCMVEIGDGTMIGSKAIILGHIGEKKLLLKKTIIGKNCIVGTESLVMPGAVIEDNVIIGAKSLVPKGAHLLKGRVYAGVPVKEIKIEGKD